MKSEKSSTHWTEDLRKHFKGRGKIHQLAELISVQHLQAMNRENERNNAAESAHTRKHVWEDAGENEMSDEEMITVLGDVTNQQLPAQQQPQKQNPLVPLALAAAIGMGGVGLVSASALAAYAISKYSPQPAASNEFGVGLLPPDQP